MHLYICDHDGLIILHLLHKNSSTTAEYAIKDFKECVDNWITFGIKSWNGNEFHTVSSNSKAFLPKLKEYFEKTFCDYFTYYLIEPHK